MMADEALEAVDLDAHAQAATDQYKERYRDIEDFADAVHSVIGTALQARGIQVHSMERRAKSVDSFRKKAAMPHEGDASKPKYGDPVSEIMDLAGVRVITFFLETLAQVSALIEEQFEVVESSQRGGFAGEEGRLGYQSLHYLVRFKEDRLALPEYSRFRGNIAEVQVRTILQHTWAEIEHDIQYKSVEALPRNIRDRFMSLAGLLEIADREFQAIADADRELRTNARRLISRGRLEDVEITADSLKVYLDQEYGADGRMSDWSYSWTTRLLKRLGFTNLAQLNAVVSPYDDGQVSRTLRGTRQGQLSRLEDVLLAAMGDLFVERHFWSGNDWFRASTARALEKLAAEGIVPGNLDPTLVGTG